jgi:uncharacterized protein YndB with AHSA1/START domain
MRLRRDIEIAAPIEQVFAFINDPGNYPALWPQIVRILDTQRLPHGGHEVRYLTRDDWDDRLSFECVGRDIEYDPPRRVVTEATASSWGMKLTGAIISTWRLDTRVVSCKELRPTERGVLLSVDQSWRLHLHRFGRLHLLEVGIYWEQRQRLQRYLQAVKMGVEQAVSG